MYVNSITVGSTVYDETLENDTVTSQSVARGKLVKDVSTITVDVIKKSSSHVITTTHIPSESDNTTTTTTTTIPGPTEGEDENTTSTTKEAEAEE